MGQPAKEPNPRSRGAGRGRQLRLVRPAPSAARRPARASDTASRSAFQVAVFAIVVASCLGLVRVAVSARIAEASIDASELAKTIKAETRTAERLELDKSVLVTPSRIESMALGALNMTKAVPARYISVARTGNAGGGHDASRSAAGGESLISVGQTLGGLIGAAKEATEKEARTLLVGDVNLATSE